MEISTQHQRRKIKDGQSKTVRQFQLTEWPEVGVPKTGEGFIGARF